MTLPSPTYTRSSAKWAEELLMEEIQEAIEDYSERLEMLDVDIDILESSEAIEKYAHLEAINKVNDLAFHYLTSEIMRATIANREYNDPIYTNHMENALYENQEDLIFVAIGKNPGEIDVRIDMSVLGGPGELMQAVKTARSTLKLGNIPSNEVRSKIWREIYQIDREGGTKIHPTSEDDVTERYVGKFYATIAERLKSISPKHAPWWHIINFGNKVEFPEEGAAIPYPQSDPTYFVEKTETAIKSAFDELYYSILEEAERVYSDLLRDDYDIEGVTPGVKDVITDVTDFTLDDVLEKDKGYITHKTIEVVEYNEVHWDLYITSTGKLGRRYSLAKNK